jgi:SAM-dependent methyltransferase
MASWNGCPVQDLPVVVVYIGADRPAPAKTSRPRITPAMLIRFAPPSEHSAVVGRSHRRGPQSPTDPRRPSAPDASCDTVVATNTVVMWPDLAAGLQEIQRVLRPGGGLVLSWHSPTTPSTTQRRLALAHSSIRTLNDALGASFDDVQRHDLTHSIAWQAQRPG